MARRNAGREGRRANEDTRPFRTTHADNGWRPGAGVVTEHFVPCSVLPKVKAGVLGVLSPKESCSLGTRFATNELGTMLTVSHCGFGSR